MVMGTAGVVMAAVWAGRRARGAIALTGLRGAAGAADRTAAGLDWGIVARCADHGGRTTPTAPPGSPARWPSRARPSRGPTWSTRRSRGAAPARRRVAGRRRVRRTAHHPAVEAGGGAGHLHLVPRSGGDLALCSRRWRTPASRRSDGIGVRELRRRCLRSILDSGVPQRLRPGILGQRRPVLRHGGGRRRAPGRAPRTPRTTPRRRPAGRGSDDG